MFKRHQILLENWLSDYLHSLADKGGLNFSEIIRLSVCLQLCQSLKDRGDKGCRVNKTKLIKLINNPPNKDTAHKKKLLSDLYFEARKNFEPKK